MVFCTLQSLAPRVVSVLRDGRNVGLRLGAESKTIPTDHGVRNTPQTPNRCDQRQAAMPAVRPDHAVYEGVDAVASGAGRSPGSGVGCVIRRSPARIAGRAILLGWPGRSASPKCKAVQRLRRTSGKRGAAEYPAASARPLPLCAAASFTAAGRTAVLSAWRKPAGRTPSASTWGGVCPA
jgi:hypothetical protein